MMKNKNMDIPRDEFDRLFAERLEEYNRQQIAKIETNHGNTYISFGTKDYITENFMARIVKLLELTDLRWYWIALPVGDLQFAISIDGEDSRMIEFIQNFIDNEYSIKW